MFRQSNDVCYFNQLPYELDHEILSYLSLVDLKTCKLVCHQFNKISDYLIAPSIETHQFLREVFPEQNISFRLLKSKIEIENYIQEFFNECKRKSYEAPYRYEKYCILKQPINRCAESSLIKSEVLRDCVKKLAIKHIAEIEGQINFFTFTIRKIPSTPFFTNICKELKKEVKFEIWPDVDKTLDNDQMNYILDVIKSMGELPEPYSYHFDLRSFSLTDEQVHSFMRTLDSIPRLNSLTIPAYQDSQLKNEQEAHLKELFKRVASSRGGYGSATGVTFYASNC